jgi:hypothetical protein
MPSLVAAPLIDMAHSSEGHVDGSDTSNRTQSRGVRCRMIAQLDGYHHIGWTRTACSVRSTFVTSNNIFRALQDAPAKGPTTNRDQALRNWPPSIIINAVAHPAQPEEAEHQEMSRLLKVLKDSLLSSLLDLASLVMSARSLSEAKRPRGFLMNDMHTIWMSRATTCTALAQAPTNTVGWGLFSFLSLSPFRLVNLMPAQSRWLSVAYMEDWQHVPAPAALPYNGGSWLRFLRPLDRKKCVITDFPLCLHPSPGPGPHICNICGKSSMQHW